MCDSYQFVLEKSTRVQISEDMARGVWYSYKLSKSSNSFVMEKQTFMSPVSYLRDNCLIHSSFCSNHGNHGHWADGPMQVRLWEVILQVSEKKAPQLCGCLSEYVLYEQRVMLTSLNEEQTVSCIVTRTCAY